MKREGYVNDKNLKILTESGWSDFFGVVNNGPDEIYRLSFTDGSYVDATFGHVFVLEDDSEIELARISKGMKVKSISGTKEVAGWAYQGKDDVFDIIDVSGGNRFYANDVLVHNCEFVSSDETLIEAMKLSSLEKTDIAFYTGNVRWFHEPSPNFSYLVALDPSLGTGSDPSAIQVFEVPGMVQVAEWEHNMTPTKQQVTVLLNILHFINDELIDHPDQDGEPKIYWTVENNSIGEAVLQVIEDTGLHNFPGTMISEKRKSGGSGRRRRGLNTNKSNKLNACSRFKSLVETDRMVISSDQLIKQLKFFVGNGYSYAAKSGERDDLVMAAILCVRMLDMVINWLDEEDAEELRENAMEGAYNEPLPTII